MTGNHMKLIVESADAKFIAEENNGQKSHYIEGIFLQANKKNQNGRYYPVDLMEREVARYTQQYIEPRRAFGELGHPNGPSINLDRASHMIESLTRDGDNFIGRAKILSTPMGNIVKALLDEGAKLGVSSRGVGSLRPTGTMQVVQSDFYLATAADIVAEPSAPEAFVQGIMEGKEWVWDNGALVEAQVAAIKDQFLQESRTIDTKEQLQAQLNAFKRFIEGF